MSETKDITTPTIKALNMIPGVIARRQHAGTLRVRGGFMHTGSKGWPDIWAGKNGVTHFIETKVKGGKLSADQREAHEHIRAAGFIVHVCTSVNEAVGAVLSHGAETESETFERIAAEAGTTVKDLRKKSSLKADVRRRRIVAKRLRALGWTLQAIGKHMHRDHTTIMNLVDMPT